MSIQWSYLNSAITILNEYKGDVPFAISLKSFFSRNKKYGSRDRKQISHYCYCFFRLGKALHDLPVRERLLTAMFLCSSVTPELLTEFKPEWVASLDKPLSDKVIIVDPTLAKAIFPWRDELSSGIEFTEFALSHLIQPDLFVRIRPGHKNDVEQNLLKAGIGFTSVSQSALVFNNATKLDNIIDIDREVVIQDLNSQRVGSFLELVNRPEDRFRVWDSCAASGGKSIMAADILADIELTVSDVRPSILSNLQKRLNKAGIKNYESAVIDLSNPVHHLEGRQFDLIIADVPCSGSGTWGRTPEQLYYFDEREIQTYATLQKKIVTNLLPNIVNDGWLLYITCSVFREENESMVGFILSQPGFRLEKQDVLKGYNEKADTMFAALFQRV